MKINQQQQANHSQFQYDMNMYGENQPGQAGDPISSRSPHIPNTRAYGIQAASPLDLNRRMVTDEGANFSNSVQMGNVSGGNSLQTLKMSKKYIQNILSMNNGEQKGAEMVYGQVKQSTHEPISRVANAHMNRKSSQQNIGDQSIQSLKDEKGKTVKKRQIAMQDSQNAFDQQSNHQQFNPMSSFGHSSYLLNTPDQHVYKIEQDDRSHLSSAAMPQEGADNYFDNSIKLNNSNMVHSSSIQFIRNNQNKLNSSVQIYDNPRPNQVSRFKSQVDNGSRKNDETHKTLSTGVVNGRKQNGILNHHEPLKSQEERATNGNYIDQSNSNQVSDLNLENRRKSDPFSQKKLKPQKIRQQNQSHSFQYEANNDHHNRGPRAGGDNSPDLVPLVNQGINQGLEDQIGTGNKSYNLNSAQQTVRLHKVNNQNTGVNHGQNNQIILQPIKMSNLVNINNQQDNKDINGNRRFGQGNQILKQSYYQNENNNGIDTSYKQQTSGQGVGRRFIYNNSQSNLHNMQNQLTFPNGAQASGYNVRDSSLDTILKRHSSQNVTVGGNKLKRIVAGSETGIQGSLFSTSLLAQDLQQHRMHELPSTNLTGYLQQQNSGFQKSEKAHHYRMRSNEMIVSTNSTNYKANPHSRVQSQQQFEMMSTGLYSRERDQLSSQPAIIQNSKNVSQQIARNIKQHQQVRDLKTQGNNGTQSQPSQYLLNSYINNPQHHYQIFDDSQNDKDSIRQASQPMMSGVPNGNHSNFSVNNTNKRSKQKLENQSAQQLLGFAPQNSNGQKAANPQLMPQLTFSDLGQIHQNSQQHEFGQTKPNDNGPRIIKQSLWPHNQISNAQQTQDLQNIRAIPTNLERLKGPTVNANLFHANGPPPPSRVGKRVKRADLVQNAKKQDSMNTKGDGLNSNDSTLRQFDDLGVVQNNNMYQNSTTQPDVETNSAIQNEQEDSQLINQDIHKDHGYNILNHKKSFSHNQYNNDILNDSNQQNCVQMRQLQSNSMTRRPNKRIIKPIAKNNASRHFPQDFFNQKNQDANVSKASVNESQGVTGELMMANGSFNDTFSNKFNPVRDTLNSIQKSDSQKLAEGFANNSIQAVPEKSSLTIDYDELSNNRNKVETFSDIVTKQNQENYQQRSMLEASIKSKQAGSNQYNQQSELINVDKAKNMIQNKKQNLKMAPQRTAPQQSRRTISVNLKNKKGIDEATGSVGRAAPENQPVKFEKSSFQKLNEINQRNSNINNSISEPAGAYKQNQVLITSTDSVEFQREELQDQQDTILMSRRSSIRSNEDQKESNLNIFKQAKSQEAKEKVSQDVLRSKQIQQKHMKLMKQNMQMRQKQGKGKQQDNQSPSKQLQKEHELKQNQHFQKQESFAEPLNNNINNSSVSTSVNHSNIITATFGGEQKFLPNNNSAQSQPELGGQPTSQDPSSKSESYTGPSNKSSKQVQQELIMMMPDEMKDNDYIDNEEVNINMKNKLFSNQPNQEDLTTDDYKHNELAFQKLHELNLKNKRPYQKAKCKTSHTQKSPAANNVSYKLAKGVKAQSDNASDQEQQKSGQRKSVTKDFVAGDSPNDYDPASLNNTNNIQRQSLKQSGSLNGTRIQRSLVKNIQQAKMNNVKQDNGFNQDSQKSLLRKEGSAQSGKINIQSNKMNSQQSN